MTALTDASAFCENESGSDSEDEEEKSKVETVDAGSNVCMDFIHIPHDTDGADVQLRRNVGSDENSGSQLRGEQPKVPCFQDQRHHSEQGVLFNMTSSNRSRHEEIVAGTSYLSVYNSAGIDALKQELLVSSSSSSSSDMDSNFDQASE